MIEDETVVRIPHRGIRDRRGNLNPHLVDDNRVSVTIRDDSFPLPIRLYFAHAGDDAPLVGLELGDEEHSEHRLDPASVSRIVKSLPIYTSYAHAVIEMDRKEIGRATQILREIGTTRRGLPGTHFRIIANEYVARVREGDSAPITSIAAAHGVQKSTASRWMKEARRRGYVPAPDHPEPENRPRP